MTRYTGPNFEIESGAVKEWELTATAPPEVDSTAVLRLGRRELSPEPVSRYDDRSIDRATYCYSTVYQDDALEVVGSVVDVVLPTADLPGSIEYLWQVDLLNASGELTQRWRGLVVITASLPSL